MEVAYLWHISHITILVHGGLHILNKREESFYGGTTPAAIRRASETDNMEIDTIEDGSATVWQNSTQSIHKCKLNYILDDDAMYSNALNPPSSSSLASSEHPGKHQNLLNQQGHLNKLPSNLH
ncbi:hypothetical protein BYT27DRAFT_7248712 [Phlegmacium glaucopus]|nr:hypothetical protein BYT27DRAFT_7248712 [Phlegmacium glaucopus]